MQGDFISYINLSKTPGLFLLHCSAAKMEYHDRPLLTGHETTLQRRSIHLWIHMYTECSTVQHYTTLPYPTLPYTTLHDTALHNCHYTALQLATQTLQHTWSAGTVLYITDKCKTG